MDTLNPHDVRLTTPRLCLRPMTESDWPTLLEWNQDPRVLTTWDSGNTDPWPLPKLQRVYRNISRHAFMFIAEWEGRPVGEAWLQEMTLPEILVRFPSQNLRRIDLSIGRPDLWGRGLGTETIAVLARFGFEGEHADAVFACDVSDTNPAAQRAFEKNGFVEFESTQPYERPNLGGTVRHLILTRAHWLDSVEHGR